MDPENEFTIDLLKMLKEGKTIFILNYMSRFQPTRGCFLAIDIKSARQLGIDYCKRFNLRFVSVQPFFLNIGCVDNDAKPVTG